MVDIEKCYCDHFLFWNYQILNTILFNYTIKNRQQENNEKAPFQKDLIGVTNTKLST